MLAIAAIALGTASPAHADKLAPDDPAEKNEGGYVTGLPLFAYSTDLGLACNTARRQLGPCQQFRETYPTDRINSGLRPRPGVTPVELCADSLEAIAARQSMTH